MISILHPSRSRFEKSAESINNWISRATMNDFEVIVSIDADDAQKNKYLEHYTKSTIIVNENRSAVDAVNNAAKVSKGNILIVVSDDTDCPHGWDEIIFNATQGKEDFVLKVFDGIQKWLCTMPVIDRKYYERFGYVYPPEYSHMFTDTHFTHVADILKKIIWRNDIVFQHLHYCVGKGKKDAINERADATWNDGKRTYLNAFRKNFGLTNINVWDISNDQHVQWLKNALR